MCLLCVCTQVGIVVTLVGRIKMLLKLYLLFVKKMISPLRKTLQFAAVWGLQMLAPLVHPSPGFCSHPVCICLFPTSAFRQLSDRLHLALKAFVHEAGSSIPVPIRAWEHSDRLTGNGA